MGNYVTLGSLLALMEQFRREFDVQTAIVNVELYGHKGKLDSTLAIRGAAISEWKPAEGSARCV